MSFLTIKPNDEIYSNQSTGAIPLRITRGSIEVTPDQNITVTNLNTQNNIRYKHFYNKGDGGITFKIEILIKDTDVISTLTTNKSPYGEDWKLSTALNYFINNQVVLHVIADRALDIPDGSYIITKNDSRKQTHDHNSLWTLEFTTYQGIETHKFKNDNKDIKNAINKAENSYKNALISKLKKCNYKVLVYSKKKKTVKCVEHMQRVLYLHKLLKKKQINGWFNKDTKKAVKKFQKKWNKEHVKAKTTNTVNNTLVNVNKGSLITNPNSSFIELPFKDTKLSNANTNKGSTKVTIKGLNKLLPENGKVDKATWKALCK